MKKKSIVVTLALALTLTALTGCGSKDSVTAGKSEVVEQETGKSKDKVKADKVETDKTKADKNETKKAAENKNKGFDKEAMIKDVNNRLAELGIENKYYGNTIAEIAEINHWYELENIETFTDGGGNLGKIATFSNDGKYVTSSTQSIILEPNDMDDPYWNEATKYTDYENEHYGNECEITFEDLTKFYDSEIETINETILVWNVGERLGLGDTILYCNRASVGVNMRARGITIPYTASAETDDTVTILRSVTAPGDMDSDNQRNYYEVLYNDTVYYASCTVSEDAIAHELNR